MYQTSCKAVGKPVRKIESPYHSTLERIEPMMERMLDLCVHGSVWQVSLSEAVLEDFPEEVSFH